MRVCVVCGTSPTIQGLQHEQLRKGFQEQEFPGHLLKGGSTLTSSQHPKDTQNGQPGTGAKEQGHVR